jgi:hypothetical protein
MVCGLAADGNLGIDDEGHRTRQDGLSSAGVSGLKSQVLAEDGNPGTKKRRTSYPAAWPILCWELSSGVYNLWFGCRWESWYR